MNWKSKQVLVTGGASFIGSTLVDALVDRGAKVRVVDNLSSGKLENSQAKIASKTVEFLHRDLLEPGVADEAARVAAGLAARAALSVGAADRTAARLLALLGSF